MDTSWAIPVRVPEHVRRVVAFQYIDPVTHLEVACHEVLVACVPEIDPTISSVMRGPGCASQAPTPKMYTGAPRLVLRLPHNVLPVLGVAAAYVELHIRIEGEVTEEWWCPAVEVEWPDGTRSRRESDCTPWAEATTVDRRRQSWQFGAWIAEGTSVVVVTLTKSGHLIARERAEIQVGESAPTPMNRW